MRAGICKRPAGSVSPASSCDHDKGEAQCVVSVLGPLIGLAMRPSSFFTKGKATWEALNAWRHLQRGLEALLEAESCPCPLRWGAAWRRARRRRCCCRSPPQAGRGSSWPPPHPHSPAPSAPSPAVSAHFHPPTRAPATNFLSSYSRSQSPFSDSTMHLRLLLQPFDLNPIRPSMLLQPCSQLSTHPRAVSAHPQTQSAPSQDTSTHVPSAHPCSCNLSHSSALNPEPSLLILKANHCFSMRFSSCP